MRIVIADNDRPRADELRRVLLGEGHTCDADDVVDYGGLAARLSGAGTDLVLVTCNGALDEALSAIRLAHQVTQAPVLAAGEDATVDAVRGAMRAGACEFLDLAQFRGQWIEAVGGLAIDGDHQPRGSVISLFSPNGGAGVSTTAINLAARLAGGSDRKVALVELQPSPGDMALMLDLKPQHTLDDVCRQASRMDRRLVEAAMTSHQAGLRVLAQAGYAEDGQQGAAGLDVDAVRQLLVLLRRTETTVVLDLAHALDGATLEAMRLSNLVGLLVRPDVPGLARARWALAAACEAGVPRERFRLVLSRCGQRGQIDADKVEQALGIEVFQRIPEDAQAVSRASNEGVPLVAATSITSRMSRISRSFSSLARNVQACTGSASA